MSELMSLQKESTVKYIDADKAKNGIMAFVNECGEIVGMFITDFNILLEQSAADVEPVRHGRWIREVLGSTSGYGTTVMYQCSACESMAISKYHYCPNCGALMMKGEANG